MRRGAVRMTGPRKVLMTVDAVGGVWRYAMDLAAGLRLRGTEFVFVGLGPEPTPGQAAEAKRTGKLTWLREPLDWMAQEESELGGVAPALREIALREQADCLHLNLPSQAVGLNLPFPVVSVSHSCVATWFRAVKGCDCPPGWIWQKRLNQEGFGQSDAMVAPSRSHAAALEECYGEIPHLSVVYNASAQSRQEGEAKQPFVLAAGRWWDEGKNGAVLDKAAEHLPWPVRMAGSPRGPNGQALTLAHGLSLGNLSSDAVAAQMTEAAIFCSPSLFEPFGLAALEAAQAGCALVLADIPTYRELWEDTALFADPRSPQSFAEALGRLVTDETLRLQLAETARCRAVRFSVAAQAEAMARVYAAVGPRESKRAAG